MASTKSNGFGNQKEVMNSEDISSSDDDFGGEDVDDYDDEEYLDELGDLELKDLDSESLTMLNAVLNNSDTSANKADEDKNKDVNYSKALVALEKTDDEDDDIDSDEERDILKGIREEIESKVREEMKDEISNYQKCMKAIEEGRMSGRTDDEKNGTEEVEGEEEMDPKLKEAITKMNKLDKILRKKIKKEKEVKRDRLLLERRMRQEISEMEHGASHYREIKVNTEKFLALAPPPSHNEGICLDEEEEEDLPPLFQTQIDESEVKRTKGADKSSASDEGINLSGVNRSESTASSQQKGSRTGTGMSGRGAKNKKSSKDFIKRNKELAANADQPVAMTDDEKKRLQELLEGIDDLPELEESGADSSLFESSPYQMSIHPGEGFCPDGIEHRSLVGIDERLRQIMPEDDYNSIILQSSMSTAPTPRQPLFTRTGMRVTGEELPDRFGERVLYETKEERELKARLQSIEQELENFRAPKQDEDEDALNCHLTDEQLDRLLDQCARNMYCTGDEVDTPSLTPRSQISSRQSLLENPPKLTDEQLQQLLSEAHFPLSSRLLSLRDDDEKLLEGEGSTEPIRAETWKAIKDANPEEETESDTETQSLMNTDENTLINTSETPDNNMIKLSSNRNKNISANNSLDPDISESSNSFHTAEDFSITSGAAGGAFASGSQPSSTTAVTGSSEIHKGLPRIRQSNAPSRADSENSRSVATPSLSSRENSEHSGDPVRLPNIPANSFLIHAQQGMNNEESKSKNNLPFRQPLQMVRNDLKDMSVTSFSEEERDGANSQNRRLSNGTSSPLQPRPPSYKNQPSKSSSQTSQ